MQILELNPGASLVEVSPPGALPLVSELLQPHWSPRIAVVREKVYLVAEKLDHRRIFSRAIRSVHEYESVDLEAEAKLRMPLPSQIEHLARLRIAKARGSNLAHAMLNSFEQAQSKRRVHSSKTLGLFEDAEWALASWMNQAGGKVLAWGEIDEYEKHRNYLGELVVILPRQDEFLPRWIRMPEDDKILLGHSFNEDEHTARPSTLEQSGATELGITEQLLEGEQ